MDTITRVDTYATRESRIIAECARRGLKIERFGQAWRIHGHGVDVLARKIGDFLLEDLGPSP